MTAQEAAARIREALENAHGSWGVNLILACSLDNLRALLAERDEMAKDAKRLRSALERLMRSFPTDSDMAEAGWESTEINEACNAHDAARAALTIKEQK